MNGIHRSGKWLEDMSQMLTESSFLYHHSHVIGRSSVQSNDNGATTMVSSAVVMESVCCTEWAYPVPPSPYAHPPPASASPGGNTGRVSVWPAFPCPGTCKYTRTHKHTCREKTISQSVSQSVSQKEGRERHVGGGGFFLSSFKHTLPSRA